MFRALFQISLLFTTFLISQNEANLEALFQCSHQTPHGQRHIRTSVTVLGNLSLDQYADETFKPRRLVMISKGKEHLLREHVYTYERTHIEGDLEITGTHLLIKETFGNSYLKISRQPFETEDGFGQEIPEKKWEYLAELVLYDRDGRTESGKTIKHPFEIELKGDDFINLLRCTIPHDVSQKQIFQQLYK